MRFRKRPVEVEAQEFTGDNGVDLVHWIGTDVSLDSDSKGAIATLTIHTLEGDMVANRGDWIIKGVQGEFYPCKPDIFEATYEAVD